MNYMRLFEVLTFKGKDKIPPPDARSVIAECTRIGRQGNEDKKPGTMSAEPIERKHYRVAGPRCIECGWSKS
jgi:hypothetical protein